MHTLKYLSLASLLLSLTALGAEPLKLFPNWSLQLGEGAKATSADATIATVVVGEHGVVVTGHKDGRTTVTITRKGGATDPVQVEVQSAGWKLVPVVVAARDLAEGTVLKLEDLAQRGVPEFLLTTSVVRPDAANYVLNQQLLVPVQAGDMLQWTTLATRTADKK
jgi:Flp pilus assembly protein CpaB